MELMEVETLVHPKDDILRRLAQGRLSAEEATALEAHLADCESCCRFLEDAPDDSFVGKLREAHQLPHADTLFGVATLCQQVEEPAELADHPRYRLIRLLGRGGMGAVYLADHRRMGRPVALKVVNSELLNQPGALARFQQEARAAAKLDHPNIVTAFDADQAGRVHFLVMGYVEGQNLADYLKQHGPLPIAQACDIVRQAALGLQHAHEHGMVHRDIKPHNLMLTPGGQVKVLDFGLARLPADPVGMPGSLTTSGASQLTGAGAVIGSADYISPEQARDAHAADCRSDIYSLGCTLYQLLTNRLPFPDGTTPENVERHGAAGPRCLASLRPEIPSDLKKVVTKMIAKCPEDRFQTAAEVAATLARFAVGKNSARSRLRLKTIIAALVLCVCSVAAAAGVVRISAGDREIIIETDDPSIEVVVKDTKIVRIVDPKTGKAYHLDRSDLTLSLADEPNGLSVMLDGGRTVTLKREGTRIATVRLENNDRTELFTLRHAKAPAVAAMVGNAFRNSPTIKWQIECDATGNALIVSGSIDAVAKILELIASVDKQAGGQPPMKPMVSVPPSVPEPLRVSPPPPVPAEITAPTPVPPPAGPVEKAKSELLLSRNALFGTADNFFKLNQFPEALRRYREIQDRYRNHFEGLLACYKIWSCVGYMVETPEQRSQVRAAALEAVKKARADLDTMPEDSEALRGGPDVWSKAEWQKRLRMIEEKLNAPISK
jgi:serine/threonine protein kinase